MHQWEIDELFAPWSDRVAGGGEGSFNPPASKSPPSLTNSNNSRGRGGGTGRGAGRGGARNGRGWHPAAARARQNLGTDDFNPPEQPQPKKTNSKTQEYYPQFRSGAFAILAQLRLFETDRGDSQPTLGVLKTASQRFSRDPMDASGPVRSFRDRYGAWSCMNSTLISKGLVARHTWGGRGDSFSLTDAGRKLAIRIVEDHGITADGDCHEKCQAKGPARPSVPRESSTPSRDGARSTTAKRAAVSNPYASAGGLAKNASPAEIRAHAAEARRDHQKSTAAKMAETAKRVGGSKEVLAGKDAAVQGIGALGSGTKRGRQLQERGEDRYAKRQSLCGAASSTTPGCSREGGGSPSSGGKSVGSHLLSGLSKYSADNKSRNGDGVGRKESSTDNDDHDHDDDERGDPFGLIDDSWLSVKPRAGNTTTSRSPPPMCGRAKEVARSPRNRDTAAMVGENKGRAVDDIIDMSLSDDEDKPGVAPPTSLRSASGGSLGGCSSTTGFGERERTRRRAGGDDLDRATTYLSGNAVSDNTSGNCVASCSRTAEYRSLVRSSAKPNSEALDWGNRDCPLWLKRELDVGSVKASDRMIDAFDLLLLVDSREPPELREQIQCQTAAIRNTLRKRAGLPHTEARLEVHQSSLPVGDFAWVWRRRRSGRSGRSSAHGSAEAVEKEALLVDCMVERKKEEDIVDSVEGCSARYRSQKQRLCLTGLKRLIYLLEGNLKTHTAYKTGMDKNRTIRTVEVDTQTQRIAIKRTKDHRGTAAFLVSLSAQLIGSQGLERVEQFCINPDRPKATFSEFCGAMAALEPQTVLGTFAKCILVMDRIGPEGALAVARDRIGPEGALAVAREFRTPRRLLQALARCTSRDQQCGLIKDLNLSDGGKRNSTRSIGIAAAKKLVSLFVDDR